MPIVCLIIIIIAQLCYTSYVFVNEKEGVHSDEAWSYGLANSYYQPHLYLKPGVFIDDATNEDGDNFNEWTGGDVYKNYLTVQKGERFSYKSVYSNQSLDHHPPFYYMLLHTISSFFPDTFSWYFAYFLSCVSLVLTQVFLFKLLRLIVKSDWLALGGNLLYGFGVGALDTFVFLRQYTVLTALCVMFTYFNVKLYKSENLNLKGSLPGIVICAFLGFFTQYTFIAYAGIFTACMCIYMLCRKKFKKMFIYGGSILGSLLLFAALYPAGVKQIFGYSLFDQTIIPSENQFKPFISYVTSTNFGFRVSFYANSTPKIVAMIFIVIALLCVPLVFLFRKEIWFIKFKGWLKVQFKRFLQALKKFDFALLFMLVSGLALLKVMANTTDVVTMGRQAMRYIFISFPIFCAVVYSMIVYILSWLPKVKNYKGVISLVLVIAIVAKTNYSEDCIFLNQQPNGYKDLTETLSQKNCVLIEENSANWRIICFTPYFYKTDNVFNTTKSEFENQVDNINSLGEDVDYVILSSSKIKSDLSGFDYEFSDAAKKRSKKFNENNTEIVESGAESVDANWDTLDDYYEKLSVINGGCEPEVEFVANIQGGNYFVIKLD